ncbi:hypothetical protein E4U55_006328 [Claviceps digitariae]|nr:hypothetical protein E4U55_006328 [Claviceps digitariae]
MPPRLLQRVLRAPSSLSSALSSSSSSPSWPSFLVRALSSTPALASPPPRELPPRYHPSSASHTLSLNKDRRKPVAAPPRHPAPRAATRAGQAADKLMERLNSSKEQLEKASKTAEMMKSVKIASDYLRQMPRRWAAGDVYSPHDLSPVEMQKWRKRSLRKNDIVDVLNIRPLDMYKVR